MNPKKRITLITLAASLGGLLFGYDTAVISGAIGNLTGWFSLSGWETGWAISSALAGCFAGALLADPVSGQWGRKASMMTAAVLFLVSAIGTAIPESFTVFVLFRIVGGVGVGIASMVVPMYIAEVAPAEKRGSLVAYNQFAIVVGIVVVYFVNYFIALQGDSQWNLEVGWRWMFASEAIPAILYLVLLTFIPESPRWLLMRRDNLRALDVLEKLHSKATARVIQQDVMQSLENDTTVSWKFLVGRGIRYALFVGIGLSVFQQVTGINAIIYYAPEIFKQFGSDANASLFQTSILGVTNLVFTIVSIYLVDRAGRKPLLYLGSAGMSLSLLVIGLAAYFQVAGTWLLPFLILFMASFSVSWGPVVWVLLAEIFPNQVRGLALSIAVFVQWVANFGVSQLFPVMTGNAFLNQRFHGAFPFLVFAGLCILSLLFLRRFVPETKHKTLEEMDELWETRMIKKQMIERDVRKVTV